MSATTYAYLGNQTTVTDPKGNWKTYVRDANGNLTTVSEPSPGGVTSYTYDALNHLTSVGMTRAKNTQTRSFVYDPATQRVSQVTTPESGTVHYYYNSDGSLQYKTDNNAQQTQYSYDSLGRVTGIDYTAPNSNTPLPCQHVGLTYDQTFSWVVANQYAPSQWGRLTTVQWQDTTCTYSFQENYVYSIPGQLVQKRLSMPSATNVNINGVFGYDLEGRMSYYGTDKTPETGQLLTDSYFNYVRDVRGLPTSLNYGGSSYPVVTNATYYPSSQLYQMVYNYYNYNNDGYTETRTYNANQQLTNITATPYSGAGINLTYSYGPQNNGRVYQATDNISGEQVTYQYDALNRLVQATTNTGTWGLSFQYDGFGNLTGQTAVQGTPPTFTASINQNTNQRNDSGYGYDGNGNQTQAPGATYSYDGANRMISSPNWLVAAYSIDNRRVWDGSYIYYYGPGGRLLGKYQVVSGGFQRYSASIWFDSKLIRENNVWVVQDRTGSVRANGNGERFNYYPYGQEMQPTTDQRTKFGTYFRDGNGVDYADQRYYANAMGRFLTPDPGGIRTANPKIPTSWNRYAYTNGDPVNHSDPRGLWSTGDGPGGGEGGCYEDDDGNIVCVGDDGGGGGGCPVGEHFVAAEDGCESDGGDPGPGPDCPPQYQAYIDAHGADALRAKLPEANALALTSIESEWGTGPFAKGGNSFFNLETFWKPRTPKPGNKFAYQLGWMPASDMIEHGPLTGYYALVATYSSASDSFKSAAATFSNLTETDPTTFAKNAVADGIYAGRSPAFLTREKTFADCLKGQ